MTGTGAPWRAALDTARGFARRRAVVWRFGTTVTAFDTTPPAAGASHLAPALEAAAGRAGEVVVVTDGEVDDLAGIPADLLRRPRVIVQPRAPFVDAYVASVEGTRHVTRTDTIRLKVSYGTAGTGDRGWGTGKVTLTTSVEGRRLASQSVTLPDSGVLTTEITIPASQVPRPGWQVLEVRLDASGDAEPRDNSRLLRSTSASSQRPSSSRRRPTGKRASSPARSATSRECRSRCSWRRRRGRWRDGATLVPVPTSLLASAAATARLVVAMGDPERARAFAGGSRPAVLLWPTNGQAGDWYVERPLSSPFHRGTRRRAVGFVAARDGGCRADP